MANPAQNGQSGGAPSETLGKAKSRLSQIEERLQRTGAVTPSATQPAPPAPAAPVAAVPPVAPQPPAAAPTSPFAPPATSAPASHADLYDDPDLQMPGAGETFPAIDPTATTPAVDAEPSFPDMDPAVPAAPFAPPPAPAPPPSTEPASAPVMEPAAPSGPFAPPPAQPEATSSPSPAEPFPFAMPAAATPAPAPVAEPVVPSGPFAPPPSPETGQFAAPPVAESASPVTAPAAEPVAPSGPFAPPAQDTGQFAAPPVTPPTPVAQPMPTATPEPQYAVPAPEPAREPVAAEGQFAAPMPTPAPEPSPALDDFDAPPPLPADSPVLLADDHEPAYASLDTESQGMTGQLVELPDPEDALSAIATADPDAEHEQTSTKVVETMRRGAVEERGGKKRGKQRVPLQPLPFDALVPGNPLVATIYSPSGGVGKSSTSMNLGVYIAAVAQTMANKARQKGDETIRVPRVLAIDGDIVMGSLLLRLIGNMEPNIHDLQMYIDEREEQGFSGESTWPSAYDTAPPGEEPMSKFVHWPDKLPNFNVLGAPKEPDLFWDFGPAEYRQIISMLGRFYDVIIIDAGTDLVLESQRAWLAHANEVFLIMSPEIDRIYNAAKAARHMAKRRPHPQDNRENPELLPPLVTRDKLSVVMTRCDTDSGLDLPEVVNHFFDWMSEDQKFWIPDVSTAMLQANNQGRFLVLDDPTYAKVIGGMAKRIFQRYTATKKQRGLPSAS